MRELLLAACAACSVVCVAEAKQFVVNGDFTQLSNGVGQFDTNTTVVGWSGNGGYDFVFNSADAGGPGRYGGVSLWDAANGGATSWNGLSSLGAGANFAALDGDFETDPISQTITGLTPGRQYYLSFDYGFGQQYGFYGDTQQTLTVTFGGTLNSTSPIYNLNSTGGSGWMSAGGFVTADATSDVLSFLAYGNLPVPPFALVSNVSLTGAGAPEASTWALMLAGFAGLGLAGWRSRRVARAA
jgi:hypothetical protein